MCFAECVYSVSDGPVEQFQFLSPHSGFFDAFALFSVAFSFCPYSKNQYSCIPCLLFLSLISPSHTQRIEQHLVKTRIRALFESAMHRYVIFPFYLLVFTFFFLLHTLQPVTRCLNTLFILSRLRREFSNILLNLSHFKSLIKSIYVHISPFGEKNKINQNSNTHLRSIITFLLGDEA